ncbi:arginase family protein [Moraxella catarrhalis]|uniref:arginase family protein n=1 Tax=Moraxella catarrhalis TaxID=480 RepID=UPI0029E82220|nr:arginase family protein [Moraxella catarrhalis]
MNLWPDALCIADIDKAIEQYGFTDIDRGNLQGLANLNQPPVIGYRHFVDVVAWNKMAHDVVYDELKNGNFPILLGGDHCFGLASLTAVARPSWEQGIPLRILWLAAHADLTPSVLAP